MSLKYIQVTAAAELAETLRAVLADRPSIVDLRLSGVEDGERTLHLVAGPQDRQKLLDDIQGQFAPETDWRMIVLPVEAAVPQPEEPEEARELLARAATVQTREELYTAIEKGAALDTNYLLLVALSTVVAAIGMSEDNVAVVIGAMVIAPLLGPNLALILATALGDRDLVRRALTTGIAGVALAIAFSFALGLAVPLDLEAAELLARTDISLSGVALALASGAAAALSATTGLSSTLVGVMVAVALLPPAATIGLMLAAGDPGRAAGAALLLCANVICVNLSGQLVFLLRAVRPRTWLEKRAARQSVRLGLLVWLAGLLALAAFFVLRDAAA